MALTASLRGMLSTSSGRTAKRLNALTVPRSRGCRGGTISRELCPCHIQKPWALPSGSHVARGAGAGRRRRRHHPSSSFAKRLLEVWQADVIEEPARRGRGVPCPLCCVVRPGGRFLVPQRARDGVDAVPVAPDELLDHGQGLLADHDKGALEGALRPRPALQEPGGHLGDRHRRDVVPSSPIRDAQQEREGVGHRCASKRGAEGGWRRAPLGPGGT